MPNASAPRTPQISPADQVERFGALVHEHFDPLLFLPESTVAQLYHHYRLFERWNRVLNLSTIRNLEEVVVRHYCESLFVALQLPTSSATVADIGSGAGFPGLPVALLRPRLQVTLVESHKRKAVFLKESSRELSNVRVLPLRAEQITERFDWLVSRAVAWEDLRRSAFRLAPRIALLLGEADADLVARDIEFHWDPPIPVPWGRQQVVLLGSVPRGT